MDLSFIFWDKKHPNKCLALAFGIYETSPVHATVVRAVDEAFNAHPLDTTENKDALTSRIQEIVLQNRLCKLDLMQK